MAVALRESWTDERLDEFGKRMDERFDKVDARFDRLDARIERRFDSLQNSVIYAMATMIATIVAGMLGFIATQI